mgnify:CR=1 FL=1
MVNACHFDNHNDEVVQFLPGSHRYKQGCCGWSNSLLQDEIHLLQGSENTIDRGLIGLADDVDVAGAELVLRDRDGNVLGAWRVADGENIRSSLDAVELVPVDKQTSPEESDAG